MTLSIFRMPLGTRLRPLARKPKRDGLGGSRNQSKGFRLESQTMGAKNEGCGSFARAASRTSPRECKITVHCPVMQTPLLNAEQVRSHIYCSRSSSANFKQTMDLVLWAGLT